MSTKQKTDLINIIAAMRAEGETWDAIAHYFNAKKILTITGGKWSGGNAALFFKRFAPSDTEVPVSPKQPEDHLNVPFIQSLLSHPTVSDAQKVSVLKAIFKAA